MPATITIPENLLKRRIGTWQGLHRYIADVEKIGLTFASAHFEVYDKEGKFQRDYIHTQYGPAERKATELGGNLYAVLNQEAIQS